MNDPAFLQAKHAAGLPFDQYIETGTPQQHQDWGRIFEQAQLTEAQEGLVRSFTRTINVIGIAGIWCGDCVNQCPVIQRIASANPTAVNVRWLDRDAHRDLQQHVRINAGDRVPVIIFCAEDYELVGWYGDKPLSTYRAMAQRALGASCSLPGAAVSDSELAASTQDWLDQIERVHLLLRLSGRLREKHGD